MEKIKAIIEKVKCTFRSICDTIKNIKANINFYKNLWEDSRGKDAIQKTAGHGMFLLKKVKPSKIEGKVAFGTGDPATTGQILGMIAALYGFIPQKLQITPDFEEKKFEGNLHVKGKLRLIHVLVIGLKMFFDKNIRYVVKKIQSKEDVKNEQQ